MKPVVGAAGGLVELHGRADRVGTRCREVLERREVSGHQGAAAARQVLLDERDREGAPFFRIGRAADLVDESERARPRPIQDRGERFHRRGERRAAGQDLLRVADLGADRPEDGHSRGRTAGERQTRLRHERKEPGGLEHHGLAAGVGTGDDEQALLRGELEVERDDGLRGTLRPGLGERPAPQRGQGGIEQRVPRRRERPPSVVRQLGKASRGRFPKLDLRLERVERRHLRDGLFQVLRSVQDLLAKGRQEAFHFVPLFRRQQGELVVGFDDVERLDENGLARSGSVVHDARDTRTGRREDREAVAVVAQDHDRVSEEIAALVQDPVQAAGDLRAAAAQLRAGVVKLARGVVSDPAVRVEEPARLPDELDESGNRVAPPDEARRLRLRQGAPHGFGRARHGEDRPEILGSRRSSRAAQGFERRRDLFHPRQRQSPVARSKLPDLGRLGQELAHGGLLEGGRELQDRAPAGRGAGEGSDEPEDEGELESPGIPLAAGPGPGVWGTARSPAPSVSKE